VTSLKPSKRLGQAIKDLENASDGDELGPALQLVESELRRAYEFPPILSGSDLDELLAYLESKGLVSELSEIATFKRLTRMRSAKDYDNPSVNDGNREKLVEGLRKLLQKLETLS
jgi:hypothetical protein